MKNALVSIITLLALILSSAATALAASDIPDGTLVKLTLQQALSSKTTQKGEMVKFKVAQAVKIAGKTVIEKGALAQAQVTDVSGPGKFGKNGRIKMNFLFVTDKKGGRVPVKLGEESAKINKEQGYAIGASAGGFLLLGPIGIVGGVFVKGKHVDIEKGTELFVQAGK